MTELQYYYCYGFVVDHNAIDLINTNAIDSFLTT